MYASARAEQLATIVIAHILGATIVWCIAYGWSKGVFRW